MKNKVEHYLITLEILGVEAAHVHSYLMTNDKRDVEKVGFKMVKDVEEKTGMSLPPGVLLVTHLSTGVDTVLQCLDEVCPEAKEKRQQATDFHYVVFGLLSDNPWHKKLMELH